METEKSKFPSLLEKQVALVRAEFATGHILDNKFDLYIRSKGGEIYTVFDTLDLAKQYIEEQKAEHKDVEFVIYGQDEKLICSIEPTEFEKEYEIQQMEKKKIEKRKKIVIKILVSIGLFLLSGILMIVFIRGGGTGLTNNSVKIQWIVTIEMLIYGILIAMFFPKDIKTYPVKKKLIIGGVTFVIFILLFFAFFLLSAILWKKLSMN